MDRLATTVLRRPRRLISVPLFNSNTGVCRREEFTMWLFFLVVWVALLAVIAVFAQQAFGYDIAAASRSCAR